jgi:hypothetical protein
LIIDGFLSHEAKGRIASIVLVRSRTKEEREADDEEEKKKKK